MLFGHFEEFLKDVDGFFKFPCEPVMFLISPSVPQCQQLGVQSRQVAANITGEDLEVMGKPANFRGINDCLRHERWARDRWD